MSLRICVYCGSKSGTSEVYVENAKKLGAALAKRGHGLVYGGGNIGLMGAVAEAAHGAGAKVTGVIPEALLSVETSGEMVGDTIVVKDMHERKATMAKLADAFVALPGGFGTLEELFEVATWKQLGFHAKPVVLLNVDGYYDGLISFFQNANAKGFLSDANKDIIRNGTDADEVLDLISASTSSSS